MLSPEPVAGCIRTKDLSLPPVAHVYKYAFVYEYDACACTCMSNCSCSVRFSPFIIALTHARVQPFWHSWSWALATDSNMDIEEEDFDRMLQEEAGWDEPPQDSAFEMPPEEEMESCAATELDPSSDADAAPLTHHDADVHDADIHDQPIAASTIAVGPVAAAEASAPQTPVRSSNVILPEETPTVSISRPRVITRRLVGKQRVPAVRMSVMRASKHHGKKAWKGMGVREFVGMPCRKKYLKVFSRVKWWLSVLPFAEPVAASQESEPVQVRLLRRANNDFGKLSCHDKYVVLQQFLKETEAPHHICEFADKMWPVAAPETKSEGYFLYARSVLLTWNGDWGVFVVAGLTPDAGWRVLVAALQKEAVFECLWVAFKAHCERLSDLLGAAHHAFSLELCMRSWEEEAVLRVHGHLYLSAGNDKMKLARGSLAAFKDSIPNKSHKVAALNNRACSGFAGCYYLLAPKIGLIRNHSNCAAYRDFGVSPEWITNMVQAEKMEFSDARAEMTRCGKGYQRRMAELKAWEAGQKELRLQARVAQEQAHHAANNLAFHSFPRIDAWLARNMQPHRRRKEILVIEGPSGLGKTEFLKALVGHEACLELNAEAMEKPMLLALDSELHKLIFWDECNVKLVLENRKLFQCPPTMIALGISPTGRDVYHVWLNDLVMAIGSNSWTEQVDALPRASDREWLKKNTVHVAVSERMWVE